MRYFRYFCMRKQKSNTMLLEFTIDNFLSFENKEVFTLQPGRGTLKKEHKIEPVKDFYTLKTAAILVLMLEVKVIL